ncbi:MAG: endonuclease, partial [Bacteroidales bacterium]|nr:endonuclease [Bacteroidales bacterium]
MKKLNLFFSLLFVAAALCAQPAATYYSSANGQSGDALRTALMNIIDGHTVVSYDNLKELYKYSDTKENDADTRNMLIDIYSECTYTPGSGYCGSGSCGGYNREHSVPKSWFNEASPMYSDAFHLYPTSCYVNSYRGNYALGECDGGTKCTSNGMTEALGRRGNCTYPGYSAVVYEPDDKYKGDLARTYFYMATRYADQCSSWSGGMFGSDNNGFQTWAINMLLEWHRADPVSEKEKIRNEAIFGNTKYNTGAYSQGNRNPFIDYPCLAEYIWGNKKGETVDFSTLVLSYDASFADTENQCGCQVSTTPILTSPRGSVAFGAVEVNTTTTQTITVQGRNLTNNVTLTLSGTNADLFSLSATTVSADEAVAGKTITITYEPTSEGNHTATLTLSSTDAASVEVTLTGNGASTYTITYNAGNGTCSTTQSTELSVGAGVELPTAAPAASCTDWTFAGWSTTAVTETQTAPELLQAGDMY